MSRSRSYTWYEKHAREVAATYEAVDAEDMLYWLQDFLPAKGGRILDVGAGSGRDAAWLADQGFQVVAVEPSPAMRSIALVRAWDAATPLARQASMESKAV